MSKIRIGHLLSMTNWGGIERLMIDFLLFPHPKSIEHLLITTSSNPNLLNQIKDNKQPWFEPVGHFKYDLRKLFSIRNFIISNRVQIINSSNSHANSWAYLLTLLMKNPPILITSEHGSVWNTRPPIVWLDKIAQRKAKLIITNSKASGLMLNIKYGIPEEKIRVVNNGVQVPNIQSCEKSRIILGLPKNKKIIGSVGRLDTPKDYLTFIDAAIESLRIRSDLLFVIIGGGPQEEFLRENIRRKGITNQFIITGYRNDARELVSAFDLFVSTSIREPFGNNLIEAALNGKAVIAPAVDGIPEAVIADETGILIIPTEKFRFIPIKNAAPAPRKVIVNGELRTPKSLNPKILAESINLLLENPDRRLKMGLKAKDRAEKCFSIKSYVDSLDKIYSELLKQ